MKYLLFFILPLIIYGCAQVTPLTGGPKDTNAPAIDSAKTTPYNGQTNFTGNEVKMKFDEYIRLNKPNDNIIVIPQMDIAPTITVKNKKLSILFNEPLQENTTYTITFNGAIQDITEKNDSVFQYVFSTGDYIDSLSVTGIVRDAFTNKPLKEALVGLYPKELEANFDSIPLKFKPTYLGQTNKSGRFELNYLKTGTYYLFAISDKNKNMIYDTDEAVAFIEEKDFLLNADTVPNFELYSFRQKSDVVELEDLNFSYPGKVEVILTNPTDSFSITSNLPLWQEDTGLKDSLIFWLDQRPIPKMRFYVDVEGELDTLKPVYAGTPDREESVLLTSTNNVKAGKLMPGENLELTFSEPIGNLVEGGVHFYDVDSIEVQIAKPTITVRSISYNTFGSPAHRLVIDSAAIESVYGRYNQSEVTLLFDSEDADYYGSLIVSIDTVFNMPVLVHLLDDKGKLLDSVDFSKKMIFPELLPGNYQLRLILDVDGNGKWTSGSLSEGREPEKVIYNGEAFKVKSKWEKEVDWILSSK